MTAPRPASRLPTRSSDPRPSATVIICSHNPRPEYLKATLEGMRAQSAPLDEWQLVLVDNASENPIADRVDLGWHPRGLQIREDRLGLSHARLAGLARAEGEIIIFVDDDNVLEPDYIDAARQIASAMPWLGAWGGHIEGVFEQQPPAWVQRYAHHLAVRECDEATWASYVDDRNVPYGAGLCIRAEVAKAYLAKSEADALCRQLDRSGTSLSSGGDHDICYSAQDLGMGIGRFPQLRMQHLIPASRMQPDYFLRLAYANARSALLLALARNAAPPHRRTRVWVLLKYLRGLIGYWGMEPRIVRAQALGEFAAIRASRERTQAA